MHEARQGNGSARPNGNHSGACSRITKSLFCLPFFFIKAEVQPYQGRDISYRKQEKEGAKLGGGGRVQLHGRRPKKRVCSDLHAWHIQRFRTLSIRRADPKIHKAVLNLDYTAWWKHTRPHFSRVAPALFACETLVWAAFPARCKLRSDCRLSYPVDSRVVFTCHRMGRSAHASDLNYRRVVTGPAFAWHQIDEPLCFGLKLTSRDENL